jgi:hypothetical protein
MEEKRAHNMKLGVKARRDLIVKVSRMVAMHLKDYQIVSWVEENVGMTRKSIKRRIIPAARALLRRSADAGMGLARETAIDFYGSIVSDETMDIEIRMKAQERLDKIYGTESPQRIVQRVVGKQETTIKVEYEGESWKNAPRFSVEADN